MLQSLSRLRIPTQQSLYLPKRHFWNIGWQTLPGKQRTFVLQCLALLATGDGGDLITRLSEEVQISEARCFYGFQIMQKHVHLELISVILDLLHTEPKVDRDVSLSAIQAVSSLPKRSAWLATHIIESDEHFGVRNAAVAIFMNVFMSSVVASLLHLTKPGEKRTHCTAHTPLPGLIRALAKVCILWRLVQRDNTSPCLEVASVAVK